VSPPVLDKTKKDTHQAQFELFETCEQYAEFYDSAPVGFMALNSQGRILAPNLTACRFLGTNRKSLIEEKLEQYIRPHDLLRFRQHLERSWSSQTAQTADVFAFVKGHYQLIVQCQNTQLKTKSLRHGTFLGVILLDVTVQTKANHSQRSQEALVTGILDTAMDAIITVNSEQQVLLFNKAAETMFRCTAQEAIGHSIERFIPERFRGSHSAHVRKFEQENFTSRRTNLLGEITGLRSDGSEFPAEASISKINSPDGALLTVICRDITTRKVVEAGLEFMNRQHHSLLHSAGEGIYGIDRLGHVTFFNRAAESMTGWRQEEIRGKFIHSLLHHSRPEGTPYPWEECPVREVLTHGRERKAENEFLWRKDGSSFPAYYKSNPIFDEKGQITGAVVIFKDITERKQADLQLLSLANRNQALLDAIPDMVVEVDSLKKMTWMNQAGLDFYGASAIGKEPKEFFVGEQNTYEQVQSLFEGDDSVIHLESWQRRQDGETRLLEWWCRSLKDANGTVMGAISTGHDITDRQLAQKKLLESERRFRTMVKHLPDGAIFTDGKNLIVNSAVLRITGYSSTELSTLDSWFQNLHGPDESLFRRQYTQDKKGNFTTTRLLPIHRKDGMIRYVEVARYGWEEGEVWLLHDVTEHHGARIALLEHKSALEKSQKDLRSLTAKLLTAEEDERRRLSRDLHDDMNQRLAVLALKIQSAQRDLPTSNQDYSIFQQLYDDISELSDDVRHLAYQLHPSVLDDLGLRQALQSLVDDFMKWEQIPITFTSVDVPATLSSNVSSCLYRLAQESLRNIAKYAQATQVRVTLALLNQGIQLVVEDDGVGFEPEAASLKKGLGLIGMKERVRLVNGTWSIVAHPGDGVTVTAWVPLLLQEGA